MIEKRYLGVIRSKGSRHSACLQACFQAKFSKWRGLCLEQSFCQQTSKAPAPCFLLFQCDCLVNLHFVLALLPRAVLAYFFVMFY